MGMFGPECDGHGRMRCLCGGDFCLCGEDDEECFGCKKCQPDVYDPDWEPPDYNLDDDFDSYDYDHAEEPTG